MGIFQETTRIYTGCHNTGLCDCGCGAIEAFGSDHAEERLKIDI